MKKQKKILEKISFVLAICIFFTSCSSTTMIQSSPSGAKVYLDGEIVGVTPHSHTDTKIVGSTTSVKIEKEGYQTLVTSFSRDEEADIGAIIGGVFVLVPFLWTMKYKATHTYELTPVVDNQEKNNKISDQPKPVQNDKKSKSEKLRELKQMLDEKLISKEDYEKQKNKILESE